MPPVPGSWSACTESASPRGFRRAASASVKSRRISRAAPASPALLALEIPLAELPFRAGQLLWVGRQWALLAGTGYRWWRRGLQQRWLLGWLMAGFTCTAAWRLHAERGQAYVLLLFLFALWLARGGAAVEGE